jgi:glycerophosphoryl diester phosphodiesterase
MTASEAAKASVDGEAIPTLSELFETFPDARFNIDPKADGAVDLLIDTIRAHDAVDRVCIGSFSESRISRIRKALGPDLCTSPGPAGLAKVLLAAHLYPRWRPPYGCLQIPTNGGPIRIDSAGFIERIHRLGLQVHYWTINDREEMNQLLDQGADAIITDEIEVLKEVLEARGQW